MWKMTYEKDIPLIEETIKRSHPMHEETQLKNLLRDLKNNNTLSGIYDKQIEMIKQKLK